MNADLIHRQAVVLVATKGVYTSKPRPWVVLQDDAYGSTDSVILCLFTHQLTNDASLLRIDVMPSADNGLRISCQLQVEKIVTVPRRNIDRVIGRLEDTYMHRLEVAVRLIIGL